MKGPTFRIEAPYDCPGCGSDRVCFEYAPGAATGTLHCGEGHAGGVECSWRQEYQIPAGTGQVIVVSGTEEADGE